MDKELKEKPKKLLDNKQKRKKVKAKVKAGTFRFFIHPSIILKGWVFAELQVFSTQKIFVFFYVKFLGSLDNLSPLYVVSYFGSRNFLGTSRRLFWIQLQL